MADISINPPAWPAVIDTFTPLTNGAGSDIMAEHINGIAALGILVEAMLGQGIEGSAASLTARLAVNLGADGGINSGIAFPTNPPPVNGQFFTLTTSNPPQTFRYNLTLAQWQPLFALTPGSVGPTEISAVNPSQLTPGALPTGVTLPAPQVTAGAFAPGVTLPAPQVTTGALPVGVTLPAPQVTAGAFAPGVTLPAPQVTTGALPVGVTLPAPQVTAGGFVSGVTLPAPQVTTGGFVSGVTLPAPQVTAGAFGAGVTIPYPQVTGAPIVGGRVIDRVTGTNSIPTFNIPAGTLTVDGDTLEIILTSRYGALPSTDADTCNLALRMNGTVIGRAVSHNCSNLSEGMTTMRVTVVRVGPFDANVSIVFSHTNSASSGTIDSTEPDDSNYLGSVTWANLVDFSVSTLGAVGVNFTLRMTITKTVFSP